MVKVLNRMDYRINVNGVASSYHANMLKQYVECRSLTSHRLISIETVAVVDQADYRRTSVRREIVHSRQHSARKHIDVSISNELTPVKHREADSVVEQ